MYYIVIRELSTVVGPFIIIIIIHLRNELDLVPTLVNFSVFFLSKHYNVYPTKSLKNSPFKIANSIKIKFFQTIFLFILLFF